MRLRKCFLISIGWLVATAPPVLAQDLPGRPLESASGIYCDATGKDCALIDGTRELPDGEITVLATGLWSRADQTGQAIAAVGDAALRAIQGPDLTRALRRLPGVTLTRNGGLGGFTGLRVRGSASEQVLVLIDGVKVNDPSSPGGGFDFGTVMGDSVSRVELLRGSNSVVWGADAIGGVVNLSTRQIDGITASAEYGGDEQVSGHAALGLAGEWGNATLAGGYITREGFSSAASGTEPDGLEQLYLTARGDVRVAPDFYVTANGRYADSRLDIDGFPPPDFVFADTAERQDTRELSGRLGVLVDRDAVRLRAGYSHADIDRDLIDAAAGPAPYYSTRGKSDRAEAFARIGLGDAVALDTGADYERTRFSDGFTDATARIASTHALLGWYGDGGSFAAGLRLDDHSRFGSEVTLGANGSAELARNLRARASWGEGFKAPTLFQLLSDFGNAALQPERSKSYEIGLDWGGRDSRLSGSLTLFRRDSRNLIDFVSCFGASGGICTDRPFGTYDNVGRARAQGAELELGARLGETLQASATYSNIRTRDRTPGGANQGNWLARRPRQALSASLDWMSPLGLNLGGDVRLVGDSFDDASNATPIDGHALLDARASWPISSRFEIYGRIENLTATDYVEVAGFNTQGRAAYLGARVRL